MKKISIFCSALLLAACSAKKTDTQPVYNSATAPCAYSCANSSAVNCPCAENKQKPRVTEIMPKSRPCCNDKNPNAKEVIPDAPEIYVIAANRTLRSMLNNNSPLHGGEKIFVAETINNETDLPTGVEKGTSTLIRGLKNAEKFIVVDTKDKADYVLLGEVSWYDTATKTVPAIKYSLALFDAYGKKIGEWNEILHQANGDRSWW